MTSREQWQAEQASAEVVEAMRDAMQTAWDLGWRAGSVYMANLRAEPEAVPLPPNPWAKDDE